MSQNSKSKEIPKMQNKSCKTVPFHKITRYYCMLSNNDSHVYIRIWHSVAAKKNSQNDQDFSQFYSNAIDKKCE